MKNLALALILIFAAGTAHADAQLVYDGTNGQYVVSIRPGEIRIDRAGAQWQLYVKQSNTMFVVKPEQQSYTRMDEDTAHALQAQMAELRDKINAQIRKLPPDKQDVARAVLAEQLPGFSSKPQKTTLDYTGATDQVAGIECTTARIVRGEKPIGRVCLASTDALNLSQAESATVEAMFGLMHTMLAGTGFETSSLPYNTLDGMPIRVRASSGEAGRTLVRVSHDALDNALFDIPEGFTERVPEGLPRQ